MSTIPASPERRTLVGKLARASSKLGDPNTDITELKRQIHAAYLRDAINELAKKFPPLKPEQREDLALLIRGSNTYDLLDSVPMPAAEIKEKPGTHAATRPETKRTTDHVGR